MSDPYEPTPPSGSETPRTPGANVSGGAEIDAPLSAQVSAQVDAQGANRSAGDEAAAVKDAATGAAQDVMHTAQGEGAAVAREAKSQVKDLYAQTRDELRTQAAQQQDRIAGGMQSVADELGSMAQRSEDGGMATDLVQRASQRLDHAAGWLSAREPTDVITEVKRFARRRPGVFIAVAAVAGIVAGRLTRALAQSAAEEKEDAHERSDAV
ncbi:hypothetical protein PU630_08400 [Microbacterium horticulturae]|uniref:DUF3618 domain-containing protein n=1 Tax=Microbacterium horticulturae TaxID=3028316 RepID=A0ABY8C269_9MICO|nr:hypothetical protein [Microbacterium sp. KACC 23027]WEG10544.1 hypothetical protein PU630_08400 [Microbacterium sp. KACC 23027]